MPPSESLAAKIQGLLGITESAEADGGAGNDTHIVMRFRKASLALGWATLLLSLIGAIDSLSGRLHGAGHSHPWIELPHQPFPVLVCFLFTGLGVLAVARARTLARWVQAVLGSLVILVGFLTVNPDTPSLWNLDRLTGWIVLLLGFGLAAGGSRMPMVGYVRQFGLFVVFFLCGLVVVGHLYEFADGKYYLSGYMRTPWISALTGLVAGHALLFQHPNFGVMRLLSGDGFGCHIMRRLLPSMIGLLVLLGWVLSLGEHRGWYPPSFGEGLYAVLAVTGFSGILLFTASSLNRLDGERHARESELRRNQEQLRAVLDNTTALVSMTDTTGNCLMMNRSFAALLGASPEECVGRNLMEIFPPGEAAGMRESMLKAIDTLAPVQGVRVLSLGGEPRSYLSVCFPLLDQEGRPYAVCGMQTDITAIKRQEEEIRRLNESLHERTLRQEAANRELEAFSYSVSHDLRAPLRHIAGFGQLLAQRNRDALDEKSRHYLDVIQTSVGRMGNLIDDLLSFSRASKVELVPKRVATAELVAEVRAEIDGRHKEPAIVWEVGSLPETHGDPAMLRLVWVNLLSNAAKYSSKNPAPRITVAYGPVGDEPGAFSVRDNGAGFDMRYADKLFGVFQRLHSAQEYEGTGIGLAMVRRILERHGGRIWAEAAPGEGACFYFVLPQPHRNAGPRPPQESAA